MENDKYPMCFACGQENPISLKLDFSFSEGTAEAAFTPDVTHQGYDGIMHGGLVSTLLDEAMVKAIGFEGIKAVTAEINIRYKHPVPVQREILVKGRMNKPRGKLVLAEAELYDKTGRDLARAEGKFMVVD